MNFECFCFYCIYVVLLSAQWGGPDGNEALSLGPIFLQCFDTVGWVIWPIKPVPDMTYNVFGGTLNLGQPSRTVGAGVDLRFPGDVSHKSSSGLSLLSASSAVILPSLRASPLARTYQFTLFDERKRRASPLPADGSLMGAYRWCSHLANASEVARAMASFRSAEVCSLWVHSWFTV